MVVRIEKEVFLDVSKSRDLNYLLQTLIRRRHVPDFPPEMLGHVKGLHPNDQELLEEITAASVIGDAPAPHCQIRKDASSIHDRKIFGLDEGLRYVQTPLEIILENNNNDCRFISRVLDVYTPKDSLARTAYSEGLLVFGNAGGCGNVSNYLQEKMRQNGGRSKFLRHFVVWDGDRRYPGHTVCKYQPHIRYLGYLGVEYHILEKRCMENYLPEEAFPEREKNREWLEAYSSLSPRQRDFMNIGGGFYKDVPDSKKPLIDPAKSNLRSMLAPDHQAHYSDVSDANFLRLADGYSLPLFKDRFPEGFDDGRVHRQSLDRLQAHQDDPAELEHLAGKIQDML